MKTHVNTYLNSLDRDLGLLRNLYCKNFSGYTLTDDNGEYLRSVRKSYSDQATSENAPISNLYAMVVDWFEGSALMDEITHNRTIGNRLYFDRFEMLLKLQHAFLKNEFAESIKEYINDEDGGRAFVEDFEWTDALSDEEYLKAARFQLIQISLWLEDQYHQAYAPYIPMLTRKQVNSPGSMHIKLNYGDRNEEILKLLYSDLNGKYFDKITFEEFEKHFKGHQQFEKIPWTGSLTALVCLFYGKIHNDKYLSRLKIVNNPLQAIKDHFVKADGKPFNEDSVSSLSQKIETVKKIRDGSEVVKLLEKVDQ